TMTISAPVHAGALTKSGAGTLSLTTATNTITGQIVVNGGILRLDAQARYGATTGFTLNGGELDWNTAGTALPKVFTVGLNGGTIHSQGAGNSSVGTAGDVLGFLG